ncbi:MAG TPA: hypothetical protein VGN20_02485 [Mucilaginibacter sp.]|jgi:hypothetical protein
MKKKIFTSAALLCCFMVCFSIGGGLTGKWAGSVKAPDGNEYPLTYVFKVDSGKLTGTVSAPQGEASIVDGKIDGTDLSFSLSVSGTKVKHTGTYYAAADSVGLDIDINGQELHTTLKRSGQ